MCILLMCNYMYSLIELKACLGSANCIEAAAYNINLHDMCIVHLIHINSTDKMHAGGMC